ncbi:MAG: hypothetical protein LBG20_00920 [Holosporaceae bacterium]|nr:hypothetical protein [Holosporaceae bacterium]
MAAVQVRKHQCDGPWSQKIEMFSMFLLSCVNPASSSDFARNCRAASIGRTEVSPSLALPSHLRSQHGRPRDVGKDKKV